MDMKKVVLVLVALFAVLYLINSALASTITSESSETTCDFSTGVGVCNQLVYPAPRWYLDEADGKWYNFTDVSGVSSNSTGSYIRIPVGRDENGSRLWRQVKIGFANGVWQNRLREWKQSFTVNVPATNSSIARNISGFRNWFNVTAVSDTAFLISRDTERGTRKFLFDFNDIQYCTPTFPNTFHSKAVVTQLDDDTVEVRIWFNNTQLQQVTCDPSVSLGAQDDVSIATTPSVIGDSANENSFLKFLLALPSDATITNATLNLYKNYNGSGFPAGGANVTLYNMTAYPNGTLMDWTESTGSKTLIQMLTFGNNTQNYTMVTNDGQWWQWNASNATSFAWRVGGNLSLIVKNSTTVCTLSCNSPTNDDNLRVGLTSAVTNDTIYFSSSEATSNTPFLSLWYVSKGNVTFVSPTPPNASVISNNYIYANVSSSYGGVEHSVFNDWNASLVGWWDFDFYNSTQVYDNSTYHNNASFWRGDKVGVSTDNITTGIRGLAFNSSGNASFVFVNDTPSLNFNSTPTGFAVFAWVNVRGDCVANNGSATFSGYCPFVSKQIQLTGANSQGWVLARNNNAFRIQFYNGNAGTNLDTAFGALSNGTWYHVGFVWNKTYVLRYINGVLSGNPVAVTAGFNDTNNVFKIGGRDQLSCPIGNCNSFNGTIDEVVLFNRSISTVEVAALYNAQATQYAQNFTRLVNDTYTSRAWVSTPDGTFNSTELRTWVVQHGTPNVSFVSPTPLNGSVTNNNWINVSISSSANSSQHSVYNDWNNSMLLWLPFDYFNGTVVFDNSTYNNNATFKNGINGNNTLESARGLGLRFDGTNDYLNTSIYDGIKLSSNGLTVMGWFNASAAVGNKRVVVKGINSTDFFFLVSTGNSLVFILESNGVFYNRTSSGLLSSNTWYHFAAVWNGTNSTMIINGNDVSGTTASGLTALTTTTPVLIGADTAGGSNFNGVLDEIQIYNRSLSRAEINASFNAQQYQYYNNFTGLSDGNYYAHAWAVDREGAYNNTETRMFLVDTIPPYFSGRTQVPPNLNLSMAPLNISYNITDESSGVNNASALLWTTVNNSEFKNSCWYLVNGSCFLPNMYSRPLVNRTGMNATTSMFNVSVPDDEDRLGIYNINNTLQANNYHAGLLVYDGILAKVQILNFTTAVNKTIELMMDIQKLGAGHQPVTVFACNSTYSSGTFSVTPLSAPASCTKVGELAYNDPIVQTDGNSSEHMLLFNTNANGLIVGDPRNIVPTHNITFVFMAQGFGSSNAWNFSYLNGASFNSNSGETSVNSGTTWSSLVGTFNFHVHEISLNATGGFSDWAYACDNAGNCANSSYNFQLYTLQNFPPVVLEVNYPVNGSVLSATNNISVSAFDPNNDVFYLNASIVDNVSGLRYENFANVTATSAGEFNITFDTTLYPNGVYYVFINATDNQSASSTFNDSDDGHFFTISNAPPAFQWASSNWTNGSLFVTPLTIQLFVNYSDLVGVVSVNMTFNNTNYSMVLWNGSTTNGVWNYNISQLAAGTYYYNFTAGNNIISNYSPTFSLVINRTQPVLLIENNGTAFTSSTASITNSVNVTAIRFFGEVASCSVNASSCPLNLTKNGTFLGSDSANVTDYFTALALESFNYTECWMQTQNYSYYCASGLLTIGLPTASPTPPSVSCAFLSSQSLSDDELLLQDSYSDWLWLLFLILGIVLGALIAGKRSQSVRANDSI